MVDAAPPVEAERKQFIETVGDWQDFARIMAQYMKPPEGAPLLQDEEAKWRKLVEVTLPHEDPVLSLAIAQCDFEKMYGAQAATMKSRVTALSDYATGPMFRDEFETEERDEWRWQHMVPRYEHFNDYYLKDKLKTNRMAGVLGSLDMVEKYIEKFIPDEDRRKFIQKYVLDPYRIVRPQIQYQVFDHEGNKHLIQPYLHFTNKSKVAVVDQLTTVARNGVLALCLPTNATPVLQTITAPAVLM
jgi:hypothetical protein